MSNSSIAIFSVALVAIVTLAGMLAMVALGKKGFLLCYPNWRSMTSRVVPRSAGVVLLPVFLIVVMTIFLQENHVNVFLVWGFMLIWAISLLDDFKDVYPMLRLVVQAVAIVLILLPFSFDWFVFGMYLIAGMAFVNFFNFMDGMDGLAGTMALVAAGVLLYLAAGESDSIEIHSISSGIMIYAIVFLGFNLPPARLFLGDSGSIALGFLLFYLGIQLAELHSNGIYMFMVLFSCFLVDAAFTLLFRAIRRKNIFEAHREHVYQRLAHGGARVRSVLGLYSLLIVASACIAIWLADVSSVTAIFLTWGWYGLLGTLYLAVVRREWNV